MECFYCIQEKHSIRESTNLPNLFCECRATDLSNLEPEKGNVYGHFVGPLQGISKVFT